MSQALVLLTSQSARARASWSVNSEMRNASRGSPRAYERQKCFQLTHASVSYDQRTSNRKVSGSCWHAGRLAGRSRPVSRAFHLKPLFPIYRASHIYVGTIKSVIIKSFTILYLFLLFSRSNVCKHWVDAFDSSRRQGRNLKDDWMLVVVITFLSHVHCLLNYFVWKNNVSVSF